MDSQKSFKNKDTKIIEEHIDYAKKSIRDVSFSQSNEKKRLLEPGFWRQCYAVTAIFFVNNIVGIVLGHSAIILPQLEQDETTQISTDQITESWIASIALLSIVIGSTFGGLVIDIIGRKIGTIIACVPFTVGTIFIALAEDSGMMLSGRFATGFSAGMLIGTSSTFIGEISHPVYRSIFIPVITSAYAFGILFIQVLGLYIDWRTSTYISLIAPVLAVLMLCFIIESPPWLLKKGKKEEGTKALFQYRGDGEEVKKELEQIITFVGNSSEEPLREKIRYLREPEVWKPLLLLTMYGTFVQLTGYTVISFYAVSMLKDILRNTIDLNLAVIFVNFFRIIVCILCSVLVRYFNRRALSIFGFAIAAVVHFGLVGFLEITEGQQVGDEISWIPLFFVIAFVGSSAATIVGVQWTLAGEIFPVRARGFCSSVTFSVSIFFTFVIVNAAPFMFESIKYSGTYSIYGAVSVLGFILVVIFLPETRGKTLSDIEQYFRSR